MDFLKKLLDFILHIDVHLQTLFQDYGPWIYGILFLIIFVETGLVIMPFLPGDSLLFATGALIAQTQELNIVLMGILLSIAAILGDTVNYLIGYNIGKKIFEKPSKWIKLEYLQRTQTFYERHGGKAIIFARFVPIIRTFAPFVAGIGKMNYSRFIIYNVVGGLVWIWSFLMLGYFLGNQPIVKKNFTILILAIIVISVLPPGFAYLRHRYARKKTPENVSKE